MRAPREPRSDKGVPRGPRGPRTPKGAGRYKLGQLSLLRYRHGNTRQVSAATLADAFEKNQASLERLFGGAAPLRVNLFEKRAKRTPMSAVQRLLKGLVTGPEADRLRQ